MKYQKINNQGLGLCYILKTNNYGYLIYSESNIEHFIVTKEINKECLYCNDYFNSLDEALDYFNDLEINDI